jgi:hypothetical protein
MSARVDAWCRLLGLGPETKSRKIQNLQLTVSLNIYSRLCKWLAEKNVRGEIIRRDQKLSDALLFLRRRLLCRFFSLLPTVAKGRKRYPGKDPDRLRFIACDLWS